MRVAEDGAAGLEALRVGFGVACLVGCGVALHFLMSLSVNVWVYVCISMSGSCSVASVVVVVRSSG